MQWIADYKAIAPLYPQMRGMRRLYLLLRFLICPFGQVESFLPKGGRFVDVGCGFGLFANLMAVRSAGREITGCDLAQTRIRMAISSTRDRKNIAFFAADVADLDLPECDVITMVDLLHHIHPDSQAAIIKQSYDKLKSGGLLVIKDIDTKPFFKYAFNYLHDFLMTKGDKVYFLGRRKVSAILEGAGFRVNVRVLKTLAPYPHILYICQKDLLRG